MSNTKEFLKQCLRDPQFESERVSKKPLRGPQAEMIRRIEKHVRAHEGGVMPILSSRQSGKNEVSAILHRRHLLRNQFSDVQRIWIRTAPTYLPQIVNSKKRLREILKFDRRRNQILYPSFMGARLEREEGYIWRVGGASVEFISSGPQANVVGATANECLDMDEAHKVDKSKFDEDFAPFTASTNAATILWGVAANGLDTIEYYRNYNAEHGREDLNLFYPCDVWMEVSPSYAAHVKSREDALGRDHPIFKTQYRLLKVESQGKYLSPAHTRGLFSGDHPRQLKPKPGSYYEAVIDLAGGNEKFNPNNVIDGKEDTSTDSSIIWIYEVSTAVTANGLLPIIRLVNLTWATGASLPQMEEEIRSTLEFWRISKVTIDAIGIGRQIAESTEQSFGKQCVNKYQATDSSVSEDLFDLHARLNHASIKMFKDDGSPEFKEFERQCGWTLYSAQKGKMKLNKPDAFKHIDMVKALSYIGRNTPSAGIQQILKVEGDYDF